MQAQNSSRLDRLLSLLENASSPVTRAEASRQLGEVQEKYPDELNALLARISAAYLCHVEWDTRVAAADSIEAIIDKVCCVPDAKSDYDQAVYLTFESYSLTNVLQSGSPLLACRSEEFEESDDDSEHMNPEEYIRDRRKKLEDRLGLNSLPGMDSRSLGVTDDDFGDKPPKKRLKIDKNNEKNVCDISEQWKLIFSSPPTMDQSWPLKWFYTRVRLGLGSKAWEHRHGAACAVRAILRKKGKLDQHPDKRSWLVDIVLRLVTVLALDRFGDFVSDSVVAPTRETAAQALGIATQLLEKDDVQNIIDLLTHLVQYGKSTESTIKSDANIWPIRHGGLLGLKWIFAVDKPLLESNFESLYSILCYSLLDRSDDCRQVAVSLLLPICDFICRENLLRGIEIAQLAWSLIKDGDDLTASTGSVIKLLSELMQYGRDNLIFSVVGSDAAKILPSLLPLMLHSLKNVREAAIESIASIMECTGTYNMDSVLQDTLNRAFYMTLIERPESKMSAAAQSTWCHAVRMASAELLCSICQANLSLWVLLASSSDNIPLDSSLVSMLREQSPTDEIFWMGSATETDRDEIYPQTRYILCHLLSEIFIARPGAIGSQLDLLLVSEEGYKRLVGVEILFLMKRKNHDVHQYLEVVQNIHSRDTVYIELRRPLTALQLSMKNLAATIGDEITYIVNAVQAKEYIQKIKNKQTDEQKTLCEIIQQNINQLEFLQHNLNSSIRAFSGSILLFCGHLPEKLNPLIKPLLESTKFCSNLFTREILASAFCSLLDQSRKRNPNLAKKLIKSFTSFTSQDFQTAKSPFSDYTSDQLTYFESNGIDLKRSEEVILSLLEIQCDTLSPKTKKKQENAPSKQQMTRIPTTNTFACFKKQSASHILCSFILYYNSNLPTHLKPLWTELISLIPLNEKPGSNGKTNGYNGKENGENGVSVKPAESFEQTNNQLCLLLHAGRNVLRIDKLREQFTNVLRPILSYLASTNPRIRNCSAKIIAELANQLPGYIIEFVLDPILSLMSADDSYSRKGAIETVFQIIKILDEKIIAFTVLFIVPILRLMSDIDVPTRQLSALTFGRLIRLMPLEAGIKSSDELSESLMEKRVRDRLFLEQLFDNKKCETYTIQIEVNATLRDYQVEGVNWLMFLNRFGLHGILSDEMGLGKTLQTIIAVASDHRDRQKNNARALPTLIVSPPSVTGHWVEEIEKFCPEQLQVLHYTGNNADRRKLQYFIGENDIVVSSYEVIRNDSAFFHGLQWNYCVLDEGHVIRNTKTKVSQSIRSIKAKHRLILSGTPIQNSAAELWSLFDFLMPGFLGSEKQFYQHYGKAIANSRDSKSSGKDQEAGILALQALHRQCLPFMLRRQKVDVLADLPPKIIQDYFCELSPLQKMLYEDFAKTKAKKSIENSLGDMAKTDDKNERISHIFQAIQYLQKLCNHPSLVLTKQHPEYDRVINDLKKKKSSISDIEHAPKFKALMQLLNDCGIGTSNKVVSEHRALIFCQHKSMLDLIESDLFNQKMPVLSYMRLDGSVPAGNRHQIVSKFNRDPSIDVLLLTTKVGGLGLNLTGADIVIFMEHDWNPQMDLQAMDRAHRIGQKKTVNVYRLITKNTVEEKIMNLQRFKLNIANTVVSTDNSSMNTMSTGQILDLFSLQNDGSKKKEVKSTKAAGGINLVNELGDLWDEREYDQEFKVNQFLEKLKN